MIALIFAASLLSCSSPGVHCLSMTPAPIQRAKDICDQHALVTIETLIATNPSQYKPAFSPDWQDCNVVLKKWADTEAARAERERYEQEKKDKVFIHEVATQK